VDRISDALPLLPEGPPGEQLVRTARPASLWRDTLRNILRQRSAVVGLVLLLILLLMAIFATQLASFDPNVTMLDVTGQTGAVKRAPPCIHLLGCAGDLSEHLMGLDGNLRDEWSRVVYGSRISLQVGFLTVGFAIVLGTILGAIAGFVGGWLDNLIMRIMDVLLAFPSLLLAIAIVTLLGPGLINAQLAIGIVAIPVYARVMRASVLSLREADFVTASRALGESQVGTLFRRVVPNGLTPLIVQGTLGIGTAILDVAALSFLGLGAQPPLAEWGSMIAAERNQLFTAPHLVIFPGIAIVATVLGFNLLGDGLRDALDPRLNR
jgi:peptide/nickel transport system permease protein